MPRVFIVGTLCAALAGCYTGAAATRDVNLAWRGRTRATIEHRWGGPAAVAPRDASTVLQWNHSHTHVSLPGGGASLVIRPDGFDAAAAFTPGEIWHTTTSVAALVDPGGVITQVDGASLRWGPPNDVNLHWGVIFGAHAGIGRLDTTPTPLPSGGVYIGGMLGPTLGLVGSFSLAAGTSADGGAMGFGASVGPQYWPVNRLWVRAGPALLLTLDPGFTDAAFHPGLATSASYAVVKVGTFALDVHLDFAAGSSVAFGSVGVGVNLN